jgi:hypothetical protein
MATVDSKPRPGTAFKKIIEEQAMLDEFMAMVKKKYDLIMNLIWFLLTLRPDWRSINGSKGSSI